jgi:hypothetical protein
MNPCHAAARDSRSRSDAAALLEPEAGPRVYCRKDQYSDKDQRNPTGISRNDGLQYLQQDEYDPGSHEDCGSVQPDERDRSGKDKVIHRKSSAVDFF